jgi:predicted nucleic acid-binding protein
MASFYPPFQPTLHVIPSTPPIEPKLYLDSNIILDVILKRNNSSINFMERIESEHWKCITSRFAFLEIIDILHEKYYIDNLLAEGQPLSQVIRVMGNRNQKAHALPSRDLEKTRTLLSSYDQTLFSFISFQFPIDETFWNKVESLVDKTPLSVADAMHLAFAKVSDCNILISRDKAFCEIANEEIIAVHPASIDEALEKLNGIVS